MIEADGDFLVCMKVRVVGLVMYGGLISEAAVYVSI